MRRKLHGIAAEVMARLDVLAALTVEPGGARQLVRAAERARAKTLVGGWMRDAGMVVRSDPAGNLIGRYEGERDGAPALLLGSRLETSVDSGRFDGPLGALAGIAVVQLLAREEQRLPVALEVAAFADEAGRPVRRRPGRHPGRRQGAAGGARGPLRRHPVPAARPADGPSDLPEAPGLRRAPGRAGPGAGRGGRAARRRDGRGRPGAAWHYP